MTSNGFRKKLRADWTEGMPAIIRCILCSPDDEEEEDRQTLPYFSTLHHKRKKKSYRTQNVCFDFLYNFCPEYFSF